ncbi:MAG: hypothetical protein HW395_1049 [candidate division NC10 bacterium]|nr:hypothetical protein [candidate division NC10 bacterium]
MLLKNSPVRGPYILKTDMCAVENLNRPARACTTKPFGFRFSSLRKSSGSTRTIAPDALIACATAAAAAAAAPAPFIPFTPPRSGETV